MNKSLGYLTVLAFVGCHIVMDPLAAQQRRGPNPDDVFVSEDTDRFNPGLAIGAQFPPIRALYQGQEIDDIDQFIRDKGAVFLVNRSVDW